MGRKLRLCSRKYCDRGPKKKKKKTSPLSPKALYTAIELSPGWYDQTETPVFVIRLCKVHSRSNTSQPRIIRCIVIHSDLSWKLFVHGIQVGNCDALANVQTKVEPVLLL